ncbi:glycosyltransferase family 4 protein [Microbacterium sp. NPDC056057]|uniref:glycosyltransferase family 4 protein n=1 Tax=Microbacterium sp. NPDC056057 TaxID=3345699 RepID=UPI0035D90598
MRRLLVLTRSAAFEDGVGGLERAISDQIAALTRLGWTVTLCAPPQFLRGSSKTAVVPIDWPLRRLRPGSPGFGVAYFWWVRRVQAWLTANSKDFDVIYAHGGSAGAFRALARAECRPRLVSNPHGMEEFAPSGPLRWFNRVFARFLARGARYADTVVATDPSLRAAVLKNIRCAEESVVVIPNGIDVQRIDRLARSAAPSMPVADIVTVGRIVHNKGYDLLLDAIGLLLADDAQRQIVWRHFGRGEAADLQNHAGAFERLTLEIVENAGDAQVQANVRAARLFVQPSRYEGSSLTTLEAMAHATICVATPVGGIPDKITDGVTGFLAAAPSPLAIRDAIRRARTSRIDVGAAARRVVLSRYDIESVAAALDGVLMPDVNSKLKVLQVARHIGGQSGVARVVESLEGAMRAGGDDARRYTLSDTGIHVENRIGRTLRSKALLFLEVAWFTVAGTRKIRTLRREVPSTAILTHGDPIGGDVYVNHGLLKEVMHKRRGNRRFYIPANPMHWFTLVRDEYRYRFGSHRAIVCLTETDKATLLRLYPRVNAPIHVIPNGVDPELFQAVTPVVRTELRQRLGVSEDECLLLFVGQEFDRKGLFVIFEALMSLPAHFRLLVVGGTSDLVENARGRAATLGLTPERIIFMGSQRSMVDFYCSADALVLPTDYETGPLVLLEAQASGLPVVMTEAGLAPEVIRDGVNGALVERTSGSVAEGVLRVERLIVERGAEAVRELCAAAVADYSWDRIGRRYTDLLRAVRGA